MREETSARVLSSPAMEITVAGIERKVRCRMARPRRSWGATRDSARQVMRVDHDTAGVLSQWITERQ